MRRIRQYPRSTYAVRACQLRTCLEPSRRRWTDHPSRARALAHHFDQIGEFDKGLFWSGIALENGDEDSRWNYAYRLYARGGTYDLRRAIYHLKILQGTGDSRATELRAEIEENLESAQ